MSDLERELTSVLDTQRAAQALGRVVRAGECIGLSGNLGAGKTAFVQGLAAGMGVSSETRVTSPTFALINEYATERAPLVHADLYRIEHGRELDEIGLFEYLDDRFVVAVEWCDRFRVLPDDHLAICLEVSGESGRKLVASGLGPRSHALLARWQAELG